MEDDELTGIGSFIGGVDGGDETIERWALHSWGCLTPDLPLDQCFHCFLIPQASVLTALPSPPSPRPLASQTPQAHGRTYADVAKSPPATYRRAIPQARQVPPQTQLQAPSIAIPRPASIDTTIQHATNVAARPAVQTYAQAAQNGGPQAASTRPSGAQPPHDRAYNYRPSISHAGQRRLASYAGASSPRRSISHSFNGIPPQTDRQTNRALVQPPSHPTTTRSFPGPPMIRLNDQVPMQAILRPDPRNTDPRNIGDFIQATSIGGHRHPVPSQSIPPASPLLSPSTPSIASSSRSSIRRKGPALRDPSLPHQCTACSKTFFKSEDLRRHITRTHSTSSRRQKCHYCDWAFINPKDLRRHEETHFPEDQKQKFFCGQCGKGYGRNDNLRRHVDEKHRVDSAYVSMSRTASERSGDSFVAV